MQLKLRPSASWAIDSEPIWARRIIVKYHDWEEPLKVSKATKCKGDTSKLTKDIAPKSK